MWEFFLGISLTCFFAVFWLKRGSEGERHKPRQREVIYAPPDEVMQYKTQKKAEEYDTVISYSPEVSKPKPTARDLRDIIPPSFRTAAAKPITPITPPEKDEFVEYTASVVEDEPAPASTSSNNAVFESELPKAAPEAPEEQPKNEENEDDDDDKKSKFSALRFFNS